MKVAIITFQSAHNYGASLQCYALQEYIKSQGHSVDVINYRPSQIDNVYKLIKYNKKTLKGKIKFAVLYTKIILFERYKIFKSNKFEKFIGETLNTTEEYKTLKELQNANFNYDIYISGSDQIWNNDLTKGFSPAYFLEFGNKNAIRASYAASMGSFEIKQERSELYRRYLKNYDLISVREDSAKNKIKKYTKKDISVVVDPTLLVDRKVFDEITVEPKIKQPYIFVHFIGKNDKLVEIANTISKKLNIPIIHNRSNKIFDNECGHFFGGPEDFVGIIANASFVLTNSFHATVFSILYRKKFIVVPNYGVDRINELLNKIGLSDRVVSTPNEIPDLDIKINYNNVEKQLEKIRKSSIDYLNNVLSKNKTSEKNSYFQEDDKFSCYGCEACKNICPTSAIKMNDDEEGFIYPEIDSAKCIKCDMCKKICIYKNDKIFEKNSKYPLVYAANNKNDEIRAKSTSGGIFTSLCELIIKQKGYVVGVKFNEKQEVVYDISNTLEGCNEFRGAKYVRAQNNNMYPKIKKLLSDKKIVLVTGTPCFIAGLKSYINKVPENLYLVEIMCHSNPSPKIYESYLEDLRKNMKSDIEKIEFRNKNDNSWHKSNMIIAFENGEKIQESVYENIYTDAFFKGKISRPSCYNCEFSFDERVGDLIIGDFWGIENYFPDMNDEKGTSLIIVNSDKGNQLFNQIKIKCKIKKSNIEDAMKSNHNRPIILGESRYKFFEKIKSNSINEVLKEEKKKTSKKISKFKKILYKTKLIKIVNYVYRRKK